ncbi:LOW QUALITY PROTEIN: uncharacterized protein LOC111603950 [Drosophila hydei]|uniref:LOW QUALITY PROTEIN: uncharacterized protein LOC111603950 n=1 Tax=Drosophila hydei TaxID=7224 RepID=A0A6J1M8F6_DROHY|nr:LOW QUALITY PROTEIN: uncharacterized protein LOC111603950 [Drosophila hydei]
MNNLRVLRSSNVLLLLTGYQMHWFDSKQQRYRLSLPGAVHIFVLACIYAGCFAQHFQSSAVLKTLLDVSPFLFRLTRLQLVLSVKVFSYAIYASVRAVGVANELTVSLPMTNSSGRRCIAKELIAYALLGSTFVVLLCFGLYIGYEMKFKLPPLQDIMIGAALFLPHLVLAGALRFYNIFAWLTRERLAQLQTDVDELLTLSQLRTELQLVAGSSSTAPGAASTQVDNLLSQYEQLQLLAKHFNDFFKSMQHSLLLLLVINANCLLFGIHSYVYYSSTWHVLFEDRKQRIFYAGNACIYACIGCDYVCLLLSQTMLEQQRFRFWTSLSDRLARSSALPKHMRRIVKNMRDILANSFRFKFLSIWRFNLANFVLVNMEITFIYSLYISTTFLRHFLQLQLLQALIIALIVIYHYLNDAILLTNERFESNDADDDE